jgi:hypothetical protein
LTVDYDNDGRKLVVKEGESRARSSIITAWRY